MQIDRLHRATYLPPAVSQKTYQCPKCGGDSFRRWELPHPLIVHWVLNPGLVFNEIVLGQRLPKTLLICKECEGPLIQRQYLPCPSCGKMCHGRLIKGFGLWRGASCPHCEQPIPFLRNVFSMLVLLVTLPLWALPYYLHFRQKPLPPLYRLTNDPPPIPTAPSAKKWIWAGTTWGGLMWIVTSLLPSLIRRDVQSSGSFALAALPIWAFGGLLFGFFMWVLLGIPRSPKPKANLSNTGTE